MLASSFSAAENRDCTGKSTRMEALFCGDSDLPEIDGKTSKLSSIKP